jgi:hypothetical protein
MAPKKVVAQTPFGPMPVTVDVPSAVTPSAARKRKSKAKFEPNRASGTFDKDVDSLLRMMEANPDSPEMSKSTQFKAVINDFVIHQMKVISEKSVEASNQNEVKTVRDFDILQGIGNTYPKAIADELRKSGASAIRKATLYSTADGTRKSAKAELNVDQARAKKVLQSMVGKNKSICTHAGVLIAAAVERLLIAVMTEIVKYCKSNNLKRLAVTHFRSLMFNLTGDFADMPKSNMMICD